jgi:hypothetical protein
MNVVLKQSLLSWLGRLLGRLKILCGARLLVVIHRGKKIFSSKEQSPQLNLSSYLRAQMRSNPLKKKRSNVSFHSLREWSLLYITDVTSPLPHSTTARGIESMIGVF